MHDARGCSSRQSACSYEAEVGLISIICKSSSLVQADALDKESLALVNAYNPGLSGAWMLQRAMSVRPGEKPNPNFINQVRISHTHSAAGRLPVIS